MSRVKRDPKGIACHLTSKATLVYFYGHLRLVMESFSDVEWNARNLLSRVSVYIDAEE